MFYHHRLKVYVLALETAKRMPSLTRNWPYYLSDQSKRALSSVVLNISEGNGRISTKERKRFFNIASASAKESASIFDIALAYRLTSDIDYNQMQDNLLQIVKMLSKLS
jgi:four helix bundle protein